jgi:hypothetical protein
VHGLVESDGDAATHCYFVDCVRSD